MNSILILGAGMVANPMVRYLLEKRFSVTIASNTPDRAAEMIAGSPNGKVVDWAADDESFLERMVYEHDLTVSLLPHQFHVMVARHCLVQKKNMVTTSYVKPEMRALDVDAKKAGVLLLNEIGLDPGIDHMSAMRIIDHIHSTGGAVLEFYSICGALPAPEAADNPFRYKFSWSPKGVVMASNNDALYLQNGKQVAVPSKDLFKNPFPVGLPHVGILEVYPNRDSLMYQSLYGIPEAQTLFRGTFRYPGWCEALDLIKQLNLISQDIIDMTGMTYADMVLNQLKKIYPHSAGMIKKQTNGKTEMIKQLISKHLSISDTSQAFRALKWLGLFNDVPMNRQRDSTFEVTSDLMLARMNMRPKERDMVVMQHTFLAGYSDGRKEVIRSRMIDFGIPEGDTAVARTVSLPAAIAVEMILNKTIQVKGIHIPVIPGIYKPVLNHLERLGIRMIEEFGLPLTENIK
jgi:saccharopine dehydrogenase-like NADP-dependent oxidoreductase